MIFIVAVLFLFSTSLSAVNAIDITLDPNDASGINGAIANITANGTASNTITLNQGIYNKTTDRGNTMSFNDTNLTIIGNGPSGSVVIDAQNLGRMFYIPIGKNSNITFINITFMNGNAIIGGAILNQGSGTLGLLNCTFTNNTASSSGGAITSSYNSNSTIDNCQFINNAANDSYGGAIVNIVGNMNINNSLFLNNTANYIGGAIYNEDTNMNITNSNFINNTAYASGGAIFNNIGNMNVTISNFTNNIATNDGGAIFNNMGNMNVTISNFRNNIATNEGGAIFNDGSMLLSGNLMSGNVAALGQMIYNNAEIGVLNLTYLNNETVIIGNNTQTILFATLTDDMGNTVTGQNISFYVNGTFIGNETSIEGRAEIPYLVNHGIGAVTVNGNYTGHNGFGIVINDGQLLIVTDTNVIGTITLDKDEYDVNETVNGNINVVNEGSNTAYDVVVDVNFPSEFVLNPASVVVSQGYYDPIANVWYIGDLTPGQEVTMSFTGKFTKAGTYTISITASGSNFNTTTDSATALVTEEPIPPTPTPNNNTNSSAKATMKTTGIPINLILLVLLSVVGFGYYRKE
ncbi:putative outer membrane protein pmp11 precursor [Methanobrevibacter cuticularis]|uniref:Putative outer membrane protein pmp11 n=1 Tax=Methanobrevibacter cuticularis TaxID=47311 RepID=A0A166CH29_9EURY|nr:DUF11 domain-containing protein [Methanobrevibacter cuticularis]KZX14501.1 putative outer membrane protein pmp11 precursor [Methanobrevibacter cuticularis]